MHLGVPVVTFRTLRFLLVPVVVIFGVFFSTTPSSNGADVAKSVAVEQADKFVDGMADVNAQFCTNKSVFGDAPSASGRAEVAYLIGYGFRHVRDSYLLCDNQAAFDMFWKLMAPRGLKLFATDLTAYTDDDIRSAREVNPGLESIGFGNEWDVEKINLLTDADIHIGDSTIVTRRYWLAHRLIPGQTYQVDDEHPETFVMQQPLSRVAGRVSEPFRLAHPKGSRITRVGDFVSDINYWFSYYGPKIRQFQPSFKLVGASLAFPANAEAFSTPSDRTDGKYGLDAVEEHGYPAPMGSNPEGKDGDGVRGYIGVNHPPCSQLHTSFSMQFNTCEAKRQTGLDKLPIWLTEYSYEVVPNGAAAGEGDVHPIPDRTAISYLARSYFFASTHGRERLYWFQMLDGTGGPKSGFCSYGLIFTGACSGRDESVSVRPKGELLTFGNLISFFSDDQCRYPACKVEPKPLELNWSDDAAPFNSAAYGWHSGKTAIVAWLGVKSYSFDSSDDCRLTSSCYIAIVPRRETLSSPALRTARDIEIRTLDTDPQDPAPPEARVVLPSGSTETIEMCPPNPKRNFYGCLTPPQAISASDGSITMDINDVPKIVTFFR